MFDYDWFHGAPFERQQEEARLRCAFHRFPNLDAHEAVENEDFQRFVNGLEIRRLLYLRDGFSYEIKQLAEMDSKSHLTFECEPVDEQYKVGAFVVSVPFEEIVRIEVFAVHPAEKPEDMPQITGFRSRPEGSPAEEIAPDRRRPVGDPA